VIGAIVGATAAIRFFVRDIVAVNADIARWLRSKLTFGTRRLIIGIALIPYIIVLMSAVAGRQWFGEHQKPVAWMGVILLLVLVAFLAPTAAEIRKARRDYLRWRREHRDGL